MFFFVVLMFFLHISGKRLCIAYVLRSFINLSTKIKQIHACLCLDKALFVSSRSFPNISCLPGKRPALSDMIPISVMTSGLIASQQQLRSEAPTDSGLGNGWQPFIDLRVCICLPAYRWNDCVQGRLHDKCNNMKHHHRKI